MLKVNLRGIICLGLALALSGCVSSSPKNAASKAPEWVSDPHSSYPDAEYLVSVGEGSSRDRAEKNAIASLVKIFGQRVSVDSQAVQRYSEALRNGTISVEKDMDVTQSVNSSAAFDFIIGMETPESWYDGKSGYYSIAIMQKAKSALAYGSLIDRNEENVQNLIALPESDKYTLEAYSRYTLAADIADVNAQYLSILSVLSPAAATLHGDARTGEGLRLERAKLAEKIGFEIKMLSANDRIKTAIAEALSAAGFKSGAGESARYLVEARVELSPVELKNNENKFSRYVLDINLRDALSGKVLLPFGKNGRSGQLTQSEADARALRAAESAVKEDFSQAFAAYIDSYVKK
jgi:hypothetical protein